MAKKRKKEPAEKQEYEFRPPDFDEKEFLQKEIKDTKTAFATILLGGLFGLIAGVLSMISSSTVGVGFLLGVAGMFSLRYLYPALRIDTSAFAKKNWLGNAGTFFLTFLAIWVLLLNMPFSDHAHPTVEKVIVWVDDGGNLTGIEYKFVSVQGVYAWVPMDSNYSLDTMVRAGYTINITAKVTDNGKLDYVVIRIGSQTSPAHPMVLEGDHRYGYSMSAGDAGSSLMFYIEAKDKAGNEFTWYPEKAIPVH